MASKPIEQINIPRLQQIIEAAGETLLQRPRGDRTSATKHYGEVVNQADLDVQNFLYDKLKEQYPHAIFVGEEDIPGPCLQKFPEFRDPRQLYIVIDPCDGSNNYKNNSNDYALTIGFQLGNQPFFGLSYLPAWQTIIMGGPDLQTTINNKPIGDLRNYKPDDIRVGYGLGKRKPEEVRNAFQRLITDLTDEHFRAGCMSVSLLRWLKGEFDLYVSLKEEWYKTGAWFAILSGIPLYNKGQKKWTMNVDPSRLDLNDAFSLSVATTAAADAHLQPGSELAIFMSN